MLVAEESINPRPEPREGELGGESWGDSPNGCPNI